MADLTRRKNRWTSTPDEAALSAYGGFPSLQRWGTGLKARGHRLVWRYRVVDPSPGRYCASCQERLLHRAVTSRPPMRSQAVLPTCRTLLAQDAACPGRIPRFRRRVTIMFLCLPNRVPLSSDHSARNRRVCNRPISQQTPTGRPPPRARRAFGSGERSAATARVRGRSRSG
jgi:hypothetical protein